MQGLEKHKNVKNFFVTQALNGPPCLVAAPLEGDKHTVKSPFLYIWFRYRIHWYVWSLSMPLHGKPEIKPVKEVVRVYVFCKE